ncbi:MAG: chalcone isomerase family protein [Betaproteobacteria bacterium]
MRKWMMVAAMALLAGSVQAVEVGGVKLADKMSVGGQDLVLNGAGLRTRAFFKVYVGSLYLPAKATTLAAVLDKGPRRIQLNLLRTLSAEQLTDALSDGIKDNSTPAEVAAVKSQTDQMVSIMKAFNEVKESDVVTLDFVDGATKIGLNGSAKGSISGDAFNKALTRIWLGEQPVQADLKRAMLGT